MVKEMNRFRFFSGTTTLGSSNRRPPGLFFPLPTSHLDPDPERPLLLWVVQSRTIVGCTSVVLLRVSPARPDT